MILHMEPVADLAAVAIHRQLPPGQGIENGQRNQFFRKLARPVIIGAIGHQSWQAVSALPGPHQMVRSRFAGRIGRTGRIGRLFSEKALAAAQIAENLICGNMMETKIPSLGGTRGSQAFQ